MCMCVYIYINIYIERERESEREVAPFSRRDSVTAQAVAELRYSSRNLDPKHIFINIRLVILLGTRVFVDANNNKLTFHVNKPTSAQALMCSAL